MIDTGDRHPDVQSLARWLTPNPGLPDAALSVSILCSGLAEHMITALPDGPELVAGLRRLLEAKDCFVRATIARDAAGPQGPR